MSPFSSVSSNTCHKWRRVLWCSFLVLPWVMTSLLEAQFPTPAPQQETSWESDSGWRANDGPTRSVIYSTLIEIPDAAWLRLRFREVVLGQCEGGGFPTELLVTSLQDGSVQRLQAVHLRQWKNTTAYFNGPSLLLEIISDPEASPSRLVVESVLRDGQGSSFNSTICFGVDDRVPSNDPRVGRVLPVTCSVWLFSDANHCFLTAGHCGAPGSIDVVEFNVPLSTSTGALQHPGPEDQYPVDDSSIIRQSAGTSQDWGYFGCFPNSNTGLTPFEAQGEAFDLIAPPAPGTQTIRVTGYGSTDSSVPPEWHFAEKTHTGPLVTAGNLIQYQVDTTGGNSGSPVFIDGTNLAIGVHTHGGCNSGGGQNQGTGSMAGPLQAALASPLGVCTPQSNLEFQWAGAGPAVLDPSGATLSVIVVSTGGIAVPSTGILHFNDGTGFQQIPLTEIAPDLFEVTLPAFPCGTFLEYYFTIETTTAALVSWPEAAPVETHLTPVGFEITIDFTDDFELDHGWSVAGTATTGAWERGVPAGTGDRGDPPTDRDGSGQCFVTQNLPGDFDIDSGDTILTSPLISVSSDSWLSYSFWFFNGSSPDDTFQAEVTTDGVNWILLENVPESSPDSDGGWIDRMFFLPDFLPTGSLMQIRFTASDLGVPDIVEAGIDRVSLFSLSCEPQVIFLRGDVNGDLLTDVADMVAALSFLFTGGNVGCSLAADLNDDEEVDVGDVIFGLTHLFGQMADPIPAPVGLCGVDPTEGTLDCETAPQCP